MKSKLNSRQYELSSAERENLWHEIHRNTHAPAHRTEPRRSFRPALALTALAAMVIFATTWQLGNRQLGQRPHRDSVPIAILEHVAPPSESVPVEAVPTRTVPTDAARQPREKAPAPAPAAPALTGRVMDKETGELLPYAVVRIAGTELTALTDSLGVFRFVDPPAGQKIELEVQLLSYTPATVALQMGTSGETRQDFDLEPMVVATLDAFDVEGAEYMVEVKSSVNEHKLSGETFDKYAIESVEDAHKKQAGVVMRAGELGRPGDRRSRMAPATMGIPGSRSGSVTGGTAAPNGQPIELMYFQSAGVNPFVATEDDALSTFALDVDNASWTLARSYLDRGVLPPQAAIRVEEFVNAFDASELRQTQDTFAIQTEGARSRFGAGYHLLRIGLVGETISATERRPANLVFVVDISGSMAREARLELVKRSLLTLLDELAEGDRVGIVVYGSVAEVRLPLTGIAHREKISAAIRALHTGGSTNAAAGLKLGYRLARESYDAGVVNRLILCSDGVANAGPSTEAGGILDLARRASDEGITLSTVGFGLGNYNDVLMEQLADRGDGNYNYVDQSDEAERVFRENLTGMLQTIAREAKVQVEFNPDLVQRWRLLGYENRDVADEDFRNDSVDAGEVGAGHQVTALYELKLKGPADREVDADKFQATPLSAPALRVGTVHLRWQAPAHDTAHAGEIRELAQPIMLGQFEGDFAAGTPAMRVQTVVAEFAEILRGSYWAKGHTLAELVPVADALARELSTDSQVQELARLVRRAADLAAQQK